MESHLGRVVPCVLYLFIHTHVCLAAPGLPGAHSDHSVEAAPQAAVLANPFGSGEEDRRFLKNYIQSNLKDGGPEINTWEQEVFFLFQLYDYDRSGLLDGLEMMKLLSDYNSHHTAGTQVNLVVSLVDFLLQTQDSNQDGLLAPSELLSPPLTHTQVSSSNNVPQQEEEVQNPPIDEERAGEEEHREQTQQELQPQNEEQNQPEVGTQEDQPVMQVDDQHRQQIPEAPAAGQDQEVPVHFGQPEI
ncbi:cell growth regulator with EF hand domain protein 1 isoform X2 [Antennarius striatus]|uniref:cell growth regulator with EF hand domain protein 1 isoform X2 n=1 Tax=Antennarius striatus TaxID=241820 RepID=UPI0035AEA236